MSTDAGFTCPLKRLAVQSQDFANPHRLGTAKSAETRVEEWLPLIADVSGLYSRRE